MSETRLLDVSIIRAVVVYGPQGCGKSLHRQQLAAYFGAQSIVEEWVPGAWLPDAGLALSNVRLHDFQVLDGDVLCIDFTRLDLARLKSPRRHVPVWGPGPLELRETGQVEVGRA